MSRISSIRRGVRDMGVLALVQAVLWVLGAGLSHRLLGVQRALRLSSTGPSRSAHDVADRRAAAFLAARRVDAVTRRMLWSPSCLTRCIALLWLLRADGIAAELRLGVNQHPGAFRAHAWVEYEGAVLFDSSTEPFAELPTAFRNFIE
jgi:hypothetical protein